MSGGGIRKGRRRFATSRGVLRPTSTALLVLPTDNRKCDITEIYQIIKLSGDACLSKPSLQLHKPDHLAVLGVCTLNASTQHWGDRIRFLR